MAKYIKREEMLSDFSDCNKNSTKWTVQRVSALIYRQTTADVAQVIRCRECEFSIDYCGYLVCDLSARSSNPKANYIVKPDFFCAYGKQKEST